jgi:hypothetical protein
VLVGFDLCRKDDTCTTAYIQITRGNRKIIGTKMYLMRFRKVSPRSLLDYFYGQLLCLQNFWYSNSIQLHGIFDLELLNKGAEVD